MIEPRAPEEEPGGQGREEKGESERAAWMAKKEAFGFLAFSHSFLHFSELLAVVRPGRAGQRKLSPGASPCSGLLGDEC